MRERYIPPFIMLLAGVITSIFNIVNKTEMVTALKQLLFILIIFYIVGLFVKSIYMTAVVKYARKQVVQEADTNASNTDKTEDKQVDILQQDHKQP